MATVALAGRVVSMTAETADKLLRLPGDAALLYLALARFEGDAGQAESRLSWTRERLETAYAGLRSAGLIGQAPPERSGGVLQDNAPAERSGGILQDDAPPEYNSQDVVAALDRDGSFAALRREMERQLGVFLTPADLKQLYTIYDYIALPPEVILTLTSWCVEEMEEKYGVGRRPRMSQIKKTAYLWRDMGIDTLNAAEEYLQRQKSLRARERKLLPKIGVRGRAPLDKEREYLSAWIGWGFPDEAVVLAYEKTLLKKQGMSWPYMNSILKSWHGKGLHTVKEITQADGAASKETVGPTTPSQRSEQRSRRMAEDLARLKTTAGRSGNDVH